MTIARTLFTDILRGLSVRNGMHHVTRPDQTTLASIARGALMCEHLFEQAQKTFEMQLRDAPSAPVQNPLPAMISQPNEWQSQNASVAPVHTIVDDGQVISPQGNNGATLGAHVPDKGPY